jgi:hypothetical protein
VVVALRTPALLTLHCRTIHPQSSTARCLGRASDAAEVDTGVRDLCRCRSVRRSAASARQRRARDMCRPRTRTMSPLIRVSRNRWKASCTSVTYVLHNMDMRSSRSSASSAAVVVVVGGGGGGTILAPSGSESAK